MRSLCEALAKRNEDDESEGRVMGEHRERQVPYAGRAAPAGGEAPRRVVERDEEQILFSTTRRNGDELRLTLGTFEGRPVVQIREWYEDGGAWRPSKKGVSLPVRELATIASALETALEKIERDGHTVRREERDPL